MLCRAAVCCFLGHTFLILAFPLLRPHEFCGQSEVVELLLNHSADFNITDEDVVTQLRLANHKLQQNYHLSEDNRLDLRKTVEILKSHVIKSNPVWKECSKLRNVSSIVIGAQEHFDAEKFKNDCYQLGFLISDHYNNGCAELGLPICPFDNNNYND